MNDKQKDTYIAWLNDAHAMEETLETVLEKQIADTEGMPDAQARLRQHLEETKAHGLKVRSCVERLGGSVSKSKDIMGKMGAAINGLGMSFFEDALVKNVHSSFAAENFEIATYTLLKTTALKFGDTETAAICDEILKDETAMAQWVIEQLPMIVEKHLEELA